MKTTTLFNTGEQLYCIAEVEQGKTYRISGVPNKRIEFAYAITDDEHNNILFIGTKMSKIAPFLNYSHTITANKTGHLCIKNYITKSDFWTEMTITVEEL